MAKGKKGGNKPKSRIQRKAGKTPESILIQQVVVKPNKRATQDIGNWRQALKSAESDNPRRTLLYDLYEDILLDGTLPTLIEKRIDAITNAHLVFKDNNQKEVEEVQKLVGKSWFEEMLTEIMNSKFWGHTLLEFTFGDQIKLDLIPRKNVDPRKGLVLKNQTDTTGIEYRIPTYNPYILEVGKPRDLGILLRVAQYVIYKRGDFGDWAQFAELFGMPFRTGKYDDFDENGREQLEKTLDEAGSAAWAVIPKSTELDTVANNSNSTGETFERLKNACDKEITISILGQTMTTHATSGSGYAQGKIHQDVEGEKHKTDKKFVARILNEKLTPILELAGFPVKDGEWSFEEEDGRTIKEKVQTATMLRKAGTPVSDDYMYEITNIPKPDNYDELKKAQQQKETPAEPPKLDPPQPKPNKQKEKEEEKGIKNFYNMLRNFFVSAPNRRGQLVSLVNKLYELKASEGELVPTWTDDIIKILENLRNGKLKPEELHQELMKQTADELLKAAQTGFNRNLQGINFDTPDHNYIAQLRSNLFNFAGAKSYQHLKSLNDLLFDEKGKMVPFYIFRDKVEEYRSAAMKVEKRYNESWLKSEYNNAMAQAQAARRWKDFEEDADIFPNLEYRTAGDAQVRYSHQKLNKIILPINHEFWDKYYPPNDWGCRCRTRPTDADVTPDDEIKGITLEGTFKNNVGKTGYIFPEKHPYYKTNEANKKAILERVSEFGRMENAANNLKVYNAYDTDKYERVDFNQESGGFIVKEKGWQDANEMATAKLLSSLGERIVLLKARNKANLKTPDASINETKFDFKALEKCTQNAVYQNIRRGKTQARHVVLHLSEINQQALINGTLQAVRMDKDGEIQGVMMLYKSKRLFVHRSEMKEDLLTDIIKRAFH